MSQKAKSPLKDKPLRYPGQSLEEQLHDYVYDKLLSPFLIAIFLIAIAAMEWVRYYREMPPTPFLLSAFALLGVLYAAFRFARAWPRIKAIKLGRDGERVVGQYLERLRSSGFEVFHDVKGDGFNVDHVLIGPAGVFSVETKTFSKPAKGEAKVQFDGTTLRAHGFAPDRDPIVQAKAQASWLRKLLLESTGRSLPVRPVVLFPGWFVEQGKGSTRDVWVLEPKALPAFLEHESPMLAAEEVRMASFHLSRFIRNSA